MSLKILPPANSQERLACQRGLVNLHQQGLEVRAFAQFFWTMSRGLGYQDASLKDIFNLCLDNPLPQWEMEHLKILNFWDFSNYVHHRKDWQILNPPEQVSSDHPALLPSSSKVHDHLLTPTEKRRDRRKRAARVAASATESAPGPAPVRKPTEPAPVRESTEPAPVWEPTEPAPASESSSVPVPASELTEPTMVTCEPTKSSKAVKLTVASGEVSPSTTVPVSVPVTSKSVMSSLDNPVFMSVQGKTLIIWFASERGMNGKPHSLPLVGTMNTELCPSAFQTVHQSSSHLWTTSSVTCWTDGWLSISTTF